ncbi:MAG: aminotransferase class V-fold PLP-dependent enzyme [Pirellulaceae bacterium]|nr:aminotransferase class V-fold PLP-dependent enzyme [Pirellulaceae bacterium]
MVQSMLVKEIAESVQAAATKVIASGDWQRYEGQNSQRLESDVANRVGQREIQLTCSGTAALEIALRAAGIGVGDEVLISGYDYPGNFWAIERVGARPVLVDTAPSSWRIDLASLKQAFQPSCKALIASHLHGELQKIDELKEWCEHHKILLIEDACQALGASFRGSPIGSYGHFAILSFGGGKLLSCGRGGAWATSDETLAIKARVASGAGSGPYAMSELQAAIVQAQFPWLDTINARCREFFAALDRQLNIEGCEWTFVPENDLGSTAFYQCGWQINEQCIEEERGALLKALRSISHHNEPQERELPFGVGFPGFHRRSTRRCRISDSLSHAAAAANCTLVLHHRVVLQQRWDPQELAKWITTCITKAR